MEFGKSRGYPDSVLANVTNPRFVIDLYQLYQTAEAKKKSHHSQAGGAKKPVLASAARAKASASVDPDKLSQSSG